MLIGHHDSVLTRPDHGNRRIAEACAKCGLVERVGRSRYMLSRRFYGFLGKKGVYTCKRGLDPKRCRALALLEIAGCMHLTRVDNAQASGGHDVVCAAIIVFPREIHAEAKLIRFVRVLWERFRGTGT